MIDVIGGEPTLVDAEPSHDDWYANVMYVDGKKCVLLTHVGTLFSVMRLNVGVSALRPIQTYVVSQIVRELQREGFGRNALGVVDHRDVRLARTRDRSVLGSMNDMVIMARHIIRAEGGLAKCEEDVLNSQLHQVPNAARGFASPSGLVAQRVAK